MGRLYMHPHDRTSTHGTAHGTGASLVSHSDVPTGYLFSFAEHSDPLQTCCMRLLTFRFITFDVKNVSIYNKKLDSCQDPQHHCAS